MLCFDRQGDQTLEQTYLFRVSLETHLDKVAELPAELAPEFGRRVLRDEEQDLTRSDGSERISFGFD